MMSRIAASSHTPTTCASSSSTGPATPASPITPSSPAGLGANAAPFRGGHRRQASLGTTMTSPSTRRRSLESTISLIKEAVDGRSERSDGELAQLAETMGSPPPGSPRAGAPPGPEGANGTGASRETPVRV